MPNQSTKEAAYCAKEPVKLLKNIKAWVFFKSPQKRQGGLTF